jgi:hypothetical protein
MRSAKIFLASASSSARSGYRPAAFIELRQVRRSSHEKLFNALIEQYHYLG